MPDPTGTSTFVEIYNVEYNEIPIFGVKSISLNRSRGVLLGTDNNKLRPVSSHVVSVNENVSIECEDAYAIKTLLSQVGAHDLTFTWKPANQNLGDDLLPSQDVTISNVVILNQDAAFVSKAISSGRVSGQVLETDDDTDPVSFEDTAAPPSESSGL
jgi:hypothetical protein